MVDGLDFGQALGLLRQEVGVSLRRLLLGLTWTTSCDSKTTTCMKT